VFAGVVLILLGAGHVLRGVAALARGSAPGGLLVADPAAWGWAHVGLGLAAGLVGLGLLAGAPAARLVAVLVALLSAVATLASVGDSPARSLVAVALDVIVVYAVTVHGGQLRAPSYR
jgi:hypothetical protein